MKGQSYAQNILFIIMRKERKNIYRLFSFYQRKHFFAAQSQQLLAPEFQYCSFDRLVSEHIFSWA